MGVCVLAPDWACGENTDNVSVRKRILHLKEDLKKTTTLFKDHLIFI